MNTAMMTDVDTTEAQLSSDEKAEFKRLEKVIEEGIPEYEEAKARVVLALYEIWSRKLWQAEHPSLDAWREDMRIRLKNHLAIRQTFYDHVEGMAKCIAGGLDAERAALLVAKSSGAPDLLEQLGVEFKKSERGREAEYEVIVPDDFEEKTGHETVEEYLDSMADMSREEMRSAVRHDSGRMIVSFSNLLKVGILPDKLGNLYAVDVWVNGPDEWRSFQWIICAQKGMPKAVIDAALKRLNRGFEA